MRRKGGKDSKPALELLMKSEMILNRLCRRKEKVENGCQIERKNEKRGLQDEKPKDSSSSLEIVGWQRHYSRMSPLRLPLVI